MENNPRLLAVKTLSKISGGAYSNLQLNQVINNNNMSNRDIRLMTNIVYGVVQHRLTLEFYLKAFIKDSNKLDTWVRELLYSAIYQMKFLDKIPNRAILNESINIAKKLGHAGIRKMVTGVLHAVINKGLPSIDEISDNTKKLSIKYSVSEWIINELIQQLGMNKTISILKSINLPSKQSIRFNSLVTNKSDVKTALISEGYSVEDSKVSENSLLVSKKSAAKSELFKMGKITIQDESAMLPVDSMKIKASDCILDACSAPGGKTIQIAEQLDEKLGGKVYAFDLHEKRLVKVKENAKRMHVDAVVKTKALDARKIINEFEDEYFDKILIDAPCSGIGLIRRKPEIRYEKKISDVEHLANIQLDILDAVAGKLKHGGVLTYSTCTILNQENSDVISNFLSQHSEFELLKTDENLIINCKDNEKWVRVFPDDFDSDGFFVCKLRKK
ncbi:16S rRNA (cytosine(967)-C(5))-methyltransferase RsmB [Apilactobacillus sp. TMW 2.2459]|uniref:16S rRNA (cytosine(967)-C(5))-methyltransferase RsmB n=1 Tax=Apilactobacillus xinyiensis TaxID=2841032 RepID=UPI0020102679|nr:16S rRNA (cytosine(967)-C(5))-methyltransferase RsmB [Apilactobacillus xinyiensis]MCL0311758.1 16S rRNA (cytosine(967)-C(5))-methyltransferase RsmB [Apilactobacillus xinyiensis]